MTREDNLKELNRLQNIIKEAEAGIDQLFQGPQPTPATTPTITKGAKKCSNCGEYGHIAKTCTKTKSITNAELANILGPAPEVISVTANGQDTERPLEFPYTGDASPAG